MNSVALRKPRTVITVSLLMMVGALSTVQYAGTSAARASSSLTAASAARAVPAQSPISQVCTDQGSASLCANRNGGGIDPGTYVIGWSAGDPNDDFAFLYLTGKCTGGFVTVSPPCPFPASGDLNDRYKGSIIAEIFNWTTELCVADSGVGSGSTVLDKCPDLDGNGGADGTIFILSQVKKYGPPPTTYAVNLYWSDNNLEGGGNGTQPRWLCTIGKGFSLYENINEGLAGTCQWNSITG